MMGENCAVCHLLSGHCYILCEVKIFNKHRLTYSAISLQSSENGATKILKTLQKLIAQVHVSGV